MLYHGSLGPTYIHCQRNDLSLPYNYTIMVQLCRDSGMSPDLPAGKAEASRKLVVWLTGSIPRRSNHNVIITIVGGILKKWMSCTAMRWTGDTIP